MCKKIFAIIFFLGFQILFGQDFNDQWKKVYQFELDGKIESAEKQVQEIYKKAKHKKDDVTIVKCFFYRSKFKQVFDENAQTLIITDIKNEIKTASKVNKALLYYIYAKILTDYKNVNSYKISQRTNLENNKNPDFLTWTSIDFFNEIENCYTEILKNKTTLRAISITKYKDIFNYSPTVDAKNFTLYDFLFEKTFVYFAERINWKSEEKDGLLLKQKFFTKPTDFVSLKIENKNHEAIIPFFEILQENEKYLLQNNQPDKVDNSYYSRILLVHQDFSDDSIYRKTIFDLEKDTKNKFLQQQLRVDRATSYLYIQNNENEKNYKQRALDLIDTIFSLKININALAQAEILRNEIIEKTLTVQLNKTIYPFQNTRAFVQYQNVDSVKISYYKFPVALNDSINNYYYRRKVNSDSIVLNFVKKNKSFKTKTYILPKRTDFNEHSTEIIVEPLETGNYLVFMEADNYSQFKDSTANAFSYEIVKATQFIVIEDKDETNDILYFYDRKSGKPIENVTIIGELGKYNSDATGKVLIKKSMFNPKYKYNSQIKIYKENDTLIQNYDRSFIYENSNKTNDEYENYEAKPMVFYDRAIYRPGQKVFYKVVLVQKKDEDKSVVPFVTTHISIYDANDTVLKEFDVQTNEFGSFSGEFDIPKNTLTGRFYMKIEEPEKYEQDEKYYIKKEAEHTFWDNVDFNSYNAFPFQVEEYKRPTFEVTFNEIKKNYTIGDSLQIIGNAKALAGNNLTNAKVAYTVSRSYDTTSSRWKNDKNFINEAIFTDEKGNFTIPILATIEGLKNEKIDNFRYTIEATVTDTNGETRTATKYVNVNQKTLKLTVSTDNLLFVEDKNSLKISATTYNNYPIEAKGELKVYELKTKKFLKPRAFSYPEIQEIDRTQFETLFPHEPYNQKDTETEKVLVKTISFDTKSSKEIALDFLKNAKPNAYEIVATALDSKNNTIETSTSFTLKSKNNPFSETELFTYKDISKKESPYFEIEIQSVIPNLFVTQRYYADKSNLQQETTQQLVNGKTIFKIKKQKEYDNSINFHFATFWENQSHEKRYAITKEQIQTQLEIEVNALRNKIEPGSTENWSFKILNSKLEAEVLASMYDSSLDQFAIQNWRNVYFSANQEYYNAPQMYLRNDISNTYINNFYLPKNYFKSYQRNPEMYWFGFDFTNPKNSSILKNYLISIRPTTTIPKNARFVYGIISDEFGALPGATIIVKGTTRGVTTDFNGEFGIEISKGEKLVVSFIGKKSKEMVITSKENLEIFLEDDLSGDEVVVIGYGSQTKKTYVSSAVFESDKDGVSDYLDVQNRPNINVMNSLQGQVAGVNITMSNGQPGSDTEIIIRGASSINGNQSPLYVIDGVPLNEEEFRKLNSNNIDSINVLKDVAATSIYGNRGANGVVIITTKKALQELAQVKTRTNFNETAFFYPNLKTDRNGNVSFEFTTPESLTKWKLRLFAHNKNAEVGQFSAEIMSQKDVMVQTNMPRFVREKDEIKISAKVVNMTLETKTGIAMLQLFDAATNTLINEICANASNVKNFVCKPKESVPVEWTIKIPEGLQGLQYKIVAKSGNFSDGEENILPVLSNKVLLTESIPVWVKGETKKVYEFPNLTNNTSSTLQNHLFTLEYTSNPTWLALQSLPYLMEYEHECAEQTFARYYANYIATQIVDSNPKIASLFETWKKVGNSISKLNMNEELKSIVLAETPWLLDAQTDAAKNNRLALLMDLNTMKESMDSTLKKLQEKQNPSGAFSWFDGGDDNLYITQHIIKGLGHLAQLFPEKDSIYKGIVDKAVPYLDAKYSSNSNKERLFYNTYSDLHYLYTRSFYQKKYPVSKKIDSIITIQKVEFKKDWLTYTLYSKALLALTMQRFGDKAFAKKIVTHLKETAARNEDFGMYWIENTNGYYWYQNAIETQALLIEAFGEIENDDEVVDELKVWLLKNKQVNKWDTTKATTEAVYALLLQGNDWTSIKDNTQFKIGNEKILTKKLAEKDKEAETGYLKLNWNATEISQDMGTILVDNKTKVPGYGGVYWQYFENLENIKSDSTATLFVTKTLFKKVKTTKGNELLDLNKENLKTGDLITVRLLLKTDTDLEFVHLKDLRASCFEPVDVISHYERKDDLSYYKSTKDVATHFFFDTIKKGTYILEYEVRINNSGNFNDGITTLQSMYAPEFSAHSTSTKVKVD